MEELLPITFGFLSGFVLGRIQPRMRFHIGAIAAIVLGTAATILTGEYRVSWTFLLVDIPAVAGASFIALALARAADARAAFTRWQEGRR